MDSVVLWLAEFVGFDLVVCLGPYSAQAACFAEKHRHRLRRLLALVENLADCRCIGHAASSAYCVFHGDKDLVSRGLA